MSLIYFKKYEAYTAPKRYTYMTSTSTAFLLLLQRVDYLTDSFNWVVGGIGISVGVAIVLVGFIQAIATNRTNRQEIATLKNELKKDFETHLESITANFSERVDKKALEFQSFVDESLSRLRLDLEEEKWILKGDNARSFALRNNDARNYGTEVGWWLEASVCYSKTVVANDLLSVAIQEARTALENIMEGDATNIDTLLNRLTHNINFLNTLAEKHPIEAEFLRNLMLQKIALPRTRVPAT